MATQTVNANGHQRTASLPYPPLPASPTLTNPDMILPDYDRASSPETARDAEAALALWKNANAAHGVQFHMPQQYHHLDQSQQQGQYQTPPSSSSSSQQLQQQQQQQQQGQGQYYHQPQQLYNGGPGGDALGFGSFVAGPITPTTPIIYGNGTMLSDIGEVTEVESTVGGPVGGALVGRRGSVSDDEDSVLRSSPTMGYEALGKRRTKVPSRQRRDSIESTSTITTEDQNALAALDDSVSVDDSNFQGDDEESVAESYVEHAAVAEAKRTSLTKAVPTREDRYSTATLSKRAEQILANAKKRLTTMEGNLSRARSSLYIASTSSISSLGSGSTPSPPIVRSATSLRDTFGGHSRGLSEDSATNSVPSPSFPRRSASALGAAGGYRKPLSNSRSVDALGGRLNKTSRKISKHALETPLEPLDENTYNVDDDDTEREDEANGIVTSPTDSAYDDKGLTRSASVAQMRNIQEQMKGLKGKISNLKEQARADSLKRRSMQSLRTPSPFTHARWDHGYVGDGLQDSEKSASSLGRNPWNGELSSVDGEEPVIQDDNQGVPGEATVAAEFQPATEMPADRSVAEEEDPFEGFSQDERYDDDMDDMRTEDGNDEPEMEPGVEPEVEPEIQMEVESDAGQPEDDDYDSESGESLYQDARQTPVSHEDREDAFDYEHFFLHSAMGTISQQRLARQERSSSFSSEDSVETTRAIPRPPNSKRTSQHMRKASSDSISTLESFATADEGRNSRTSLQLQEGDARQTVIPSEHSIEEEDEGEEEPRTARPRFSTSLPGASTTSLHSTGRNNLVGSRPISTTATILHRPSVSSFESTGTNRSFPLVNRPKTMHSTISSSASTNANGGGAAGMLLTPQDSPDPELKQISDELMDETASVLEGRGSALGVASGEGAVKMQQMLLAREDQLLVERLVESLGKCVLGMGESGRASAESRVFRRRIDAARRILEGVDGAV